MDEYIEVVYDDEDYGEMEEENVDENMDMNNLFYDAEAIKQKDKLGAIDKYYECVKLAHEKKETEMEFNCYVSIALLQFDLPTPNAKILETLDLVFTNSKGIADLKLTDSIKSIIDTIGIDKDTKSKQELLRYFVDKLKDKKYPKLLIYSYMKLAQIAIDLGEYTDADKYIDEIEKLNPTSTSTLEVIALKLSNYIQRRQYSHISELINSVNDENVVDPRIICVLSEAKGLLAIKTKDWQVAYSKMFSAFIKYLECGKANKSKEALIYAMIIAIIIDIPLDPSDGNEGRRFVEDPYVVEAKKLRSYYLNGEMILFRELIASPNNILNTIDIVSENKDLLIEKMKGNWIVKLCTIYTTLNFSYLSENVGIPIDNLTTYLIQLIRSKKINAKIDKPNNLLRIFPKLPQHGLDRLNYWNALDQMGDSIGHIISQMN